jgi:hypothetical protein
MVTSAAVPAEFGGSLRVPTRGEMGRDCELLGKEESVLSYLESKARTLPPLVENVGPGEDGGCGFGACDAGWREEVGGGADGRGRLVSE